MPCPRLSYTALQRTLWALSLCAFFQNAEARTVQRHGVKLRNLEEHYFLDRQTKMPFYSVSTTAKPRCGIPIGMSAHFDEIPSEASFDNGTNLSFDIERGTLPWLVYINMPQVKSDSPGMYCAGALISERHVITSGHCINRAEPDSDVFAEFEQQDGNTILIKGTFMIHENFNKPYEGDEYYDNDIGLITLDQDVSLLSGFLYTPICLPETAERNAYTDMCVFVEFLHYSTRAYGTYVRMATMPDGDYIISVNNGPSNYIFNFGGFGMCKHSTDQYTIFGLLDKAFSSPKSQYRIFETVAEYRNWIDEKSKE